MTIIVLPRAVRPMPKHCVQVVHMSSAATRTRNHRIQVAERRGLPADVCGCKPRFVINGRALCQNHAGQEAIRILRRSGDDIE